MSKTVFILNDAPYGSERSYNALRLAGSIANRDGEEVRVFLLGDSVSCAKAGQKVPQGYYKIENMLRPVVRGEGKVGVCGQCLDARGLSEETLADGRHRGSMDELADWTLWAERVLVF